MDERRSEEFESFFRQHALAAIQHLVRLGFNPDIAEEAVETTMVTLCLRWETIQHPRAWVKCTAKGHALSLVKDQLQALSIDVERDSASLRHEDDDSIIQEESKARIAQLLDGLTPQRQAVMSAWLDGCTSREIAEELEISEGTVRSHKRYALRDIAAKLRLEGGLS